jgi:hypothetical protein
MKSQTVICLDVISSEWVAHSYSSQSVVGDRLSLQSVSRWCEIRRARAAAFLNPVVGVD